MGTGPIQPQGRDVFFGHWSLENAIARMAAPPLTGSGLTPLDIDAVTTDRPRPERAVSMWQQPSATEPMRGRASAPASAEGRLVAVSQFRTGQVSRETKTTQSSTP